tara:strand:- start:266 stop:679 length:414 start_codon:yes stop_codon:yes gene_type:complete
MKKFIKKLIGQDKVEANQAKIDQQEKELKEKELAHVKGTDPKAYATRKKMPWVNVLDMKVNEKNIRNGFFELDWNKYFIVELIRHGYGTESDPEEEVVDRWFKDIVYNMLSEEGMDTDRGAGYINVKPLADGASEVS